MAKKRDGGARTGPGYDGHFELGLRTAEDPYEPGRRVTVTVNVRESAIDHMASRGRLDTSQVAAGDRFRRLWEMAAIGRQRGIDLTSAGGGPGAISDPLTDDLVRAGRTLAQAIGRLGMVRSRILVSIVGEGKRIEDVARDWARAGGIVSGKRAEGYVTGTLIDAIDDLVRIWKLEAKGSADLSPGHYLRGGEEIVVNDSIRGSGPMAYTGPVDEVSVGKFGDVTVDKRRGVDSGLLTKHVSGNLPPRARRR